LAQKEPLLKTSSFEENSLEVTSFLFLEITPALSRSYKHDGKTTHYWRIPYSPEVKKPEGTSNVKDGEDKDSCYDNYCSHFSQHDAIVNVPSYHNHNVPATHPLV
jgi:hypothetical protein